MSISRSSVLDTLTQKGFSCSNISDYKTLDTILHLTCSNGHDIDINFRTARDERFKCPACEGKDSLGTLVFSNEPPKKSGTRIVAVDNATKHAGVAVFDNGKLVHYELKQFSGDTIERLAANRAYFKNTIIKKWQPDLIVLEDIQLERNVQLFKTLAMLLGNARTVVYEYGIPCEVVASATWRAKYMIAGKRIEDKGQAIDRVMNMYGVVVGDDIAEAILLGKYAVDAMNTPKPKKLF